MSGLRLSWGIVFCALALVSCSVPRDPIDPTGKLTRSDYQDLHNRAPTIIEEQKPEPAIPELRAATQKTAPSAPPEVLVSLTVNETASLRDVLSELAKKGGLNLELDPRIGSANGVIFVVHDQPFSTVLRHLCYLAALRYRVEDGFLRVELDEPYMANYPLDYLSVTRKTHSEIGISSNIAAVNVGNNAQQNYQGTSENKSQAKIESDSNSDFWSEIEKNVEQILSGTARNRSLIGDASKQADDQKQKPSFNINRQAGLLSVWGNEKQQKAVESYLHKLSRSATAQVLIEARIVEVSLSEQFQSGINWQSFFHNAANVGGSFSPSSGLLSSGNLASFWVNRGDLAGMVSLAREFGPVRTLSSPRLTVINNQTAILKVARNEVYFTSSVPQNTTATSGGGNTVVNLPVVSTPNTVPIGLVMAVQPSISSDTGQITLTLRPTISRISGYRDDPTPSLRDAGTTSSIPVVEVREMDSVLRMQSGSVAVLGGLMQDESRNTEKGIPPLDALSFAGIFSKSRNNDSNVTELVVFLRATIIDQSSPDSADIDLYQRYNRDPRPIVTQ